MEIKEYSPDKAAEMYAEVARLESTDIITVMGEGKYRVYQEIKHYAVKEAR